MTQFLFVNPPNEMPIFVAILDFFGGNLTVSAAERCRKMAHVRKAINSGTPPNEAPTFVAIHDFFLAGN